MAVDPSNAVWMSGIVLVSIVALLIIRLRLRHQTDGEVPSSIEESAAGPRSSTTGQEAGQRKNRAVVEPEPGRPPTDTPSDPGLLSGRTLRVLATGAGAALLLGALFVLFEPRAFSAGGLILWVSVEQFLSTSIRVIAVGGMLGGLVIYFTRHVARLNRSSRSGRLKPAVPYPPEAVNTDPKSRAGEKFDRSMEVIKNSRSQPGEADSDVRASLRQTALGILSEFGGYETDDASARLESGVWTDDLLAAAFLGGDDAPAPSWKTELFDLLRAQDRTTRKIRHTVDALERVADRKTDRRRDS